jgi:intracellular multiplication protein IcmJ
MVQKRVVPNLVMSAKRSVWRMNDHGGEGADKDFQRLRSAILDACGGRCEFCQVAFARYQEVHHGDDDHRNNARENLFGACPLCHQVFHIGLAGMTDGAYIIYAPELTQAEVNQVSLLIWIVDSTSDSAVTGDHLFKRIRASAQKLRGDLEVRRGAVLLRMQSYLERNKLLPEDMKPKLSHYSPAMFANVLMSLDEDTYARRGELMGGLRLLPKPERFKDRVEYWRDEQAKIMSITDWPSLVPERQLFDIILTCSKQFEALGQTLGQANPASQSAQSAGQPPAAG